MVPMYDENDTPGTVRAFVGLDLPESARAATGETQRLWRSRLGTEVGWTDPENFHITLVFLGALDGERLAAAQAALRACAPLLAPARIGLGPASAFPNPEKPRVLVRLIGDTTGRLHTLRDGLVAAYEPLGYKPNHGKFVPHVTLGYAHDRKPVDIPPELWTERPEWTATKLTLFVSRETPQGQRYLPVDIRGLGGK
jgi:2'-5' RNA ligase